MTDFSIPLEINPEKNLSRYLQAIRKFPMLDPEEELALAKRWRDLGDGQAAQKLVTSHLRLVAKIAMGLRRSLLVVAMKGLTERERHILAERRLQDSPTTLQNLSRLYGISRERVRQIESRAFEKIQKSVRNAVIEQHIAC